MATSLEKALPPVIVKRIKKAAHGSHGGVWKIAYADFVTAMMAFFLLMWVLGSTTSGDLAGISSYFQNPLRVAIAGGSGSGDATRIIKGGGDNIFRQEGQEARADSNAPQRKTSNEEQVSEEFNRMQQRRMEQLKADLERQISADPALDKMKSQIFMDITAEGLRIQIVDENSRPMFELGGATMTPPTRQLLQMIGRVLSGMDNRLRIEGHTDAKRFGSGPAGYGNWELSSERANAARREIVASGFSEQRIAFVAGFADTIQLNPADASDPLNRRISLLVLRASSRDAKPAVPMPPAAASAPPGPATPQATPGPRLSFGTGETTGTAGDRRQGGAPADRAGSNDRPYAAGLSQSAGGGSASAPLPGSASAASAGGALTLPPAPGVRREPAEPRSDAGNNRGQAVVLPAR